MFDETDKYLNTGNFFLKKGDDLFLASVDIPQLPGVYYVMKLAKGRVELVYIGKSGTLGADGIFTNDQLLRERINGKQEGMKPRPYLQNKVGGANIDALDIYWFVTMDKENNDLPGYVEGLLMQRYFKIYGTLPPWNKYF